MNAPPSTQELLLARLAHLQETPATGAWLCVRALHSHTVRAVTVEQPGLAVVLAGAKRVVGGMAGDGPACLAVPGEALVLQANRQLDLAHEPDPASGDYRALGLAFGPEVRAAAQTLWGRPPRPAAAPAAPVPLAPLLPALTQWLQVVDRGAGEALLRHALTGLLLALCEAGHDSLLTRPEPDLPERIRTLVAAAPAHDWRSDELERQLGMSGATLRRRLAAAGTSVRQQVADARLAQALTLLYGTRLPVKTVAQRVGYASTSSFAKRFQERYGMEPSRIADWPATA